jgi:hypothetical protein
MIRTPRMALCVLVLGVLLAISAGAAPAFADAPWWRLSSTPAPTNLPSEGEGQLLVSATNIGDAEANGSVSPITLTDKLPSGLEVTKLEAWAGPRPGGEFTVLSCTRTSTTISCPFTGKLPPYEEIAMKITVNMEEPANTDAALPNELRVEGGEAESASAIRSLEVNGEPTRFGVERYELTPENEGGSLDTQAGSHPFQLTTTFNLNRTLAIDPSKGEPKEEPSAPALVKNVHFDLPPGLVGDTTAMPQCSGADFAALVPGDINECPGDTAVGVASVTINEPALLNTFTEPVPVFNLVPSPGEPARFGFAIHNVPVVLTTAVRTGSDYGVEVSVHYASQSVQLLSSQVTLWGVPGAASHDAERGWDCLGNGVYVAQDEPRPPCTPLGDAQPAPFLILPTSCSGTQTSTVDGESWDGESLAREIEHPFTFDGCNLLELNPSISVEPETHEASTPTGMTVKVRVPQESTLAATGLAEADVRATTLTLPMGLQASPAAADGLFACSADAGTENVGFTGNFETAPGVINPDQNEEFSPGPATCPAPSKIGTVTIRTPLLEHELQGFVYLAEQDTNPFTSPLVLYLVAEDPISGVRVKLAGSVALNEATGQLTSTFTQTPPLPFEELTLSLFGGPRASQSTPAKCGSYPSAASFTPWSGGEAAAASSSFQVTSGPHGGACTYAPNALPFAPSFVAGSTNNQAGAFTPFTLTIDKPDGGQALESITTQLPPGLAATIAAVTPCQNPQAIEALPTLSSSPPPCGAESLIGHTMTSSGLGGDPVTLPGKLYLTQGVDGAPFGLLASTEATAGPFHLGYVNVLSTIAINETTTAVTTRTVKPIPKIVDGVPVQLKQINVTVERPGNAPFEFNPTNCSRTEVGGTLGGDEGISDPVSSPFQVADCAALPFKPELTASVAGQGSKADGTTFKVTIKSPGLGQANIHKVDLTIPASLPSRLETLQKACVEKVFDANPASCDEGSVIGEGIVYTPVFKNPLRGPAYLVSHGGRAFPDVEFVLQGEGVKIVLDGETDIVEGVTYSKFETAPDAPFTKFESIFPAGPHGVLTPHVAESEHYNLCKTSLSLPTELTAQNGANISQTTNVEVTGCAGVKSFKVTKAQLLAKALKVCKKDKNKSKRVACEKAARKKYATKASKSAKKSSRTK